MRLSAFFIIILVFLDFLGISANSFAETSDPDCSPPTHLLRFYDENGSVLGVVNLDDYFSSTSYTWFLNDTKIAKVSYMVLNEGEEVIARDYTLNIVGNSTTVNTEIRTYSVVYAPCENNAATYAYSVWNITFNESLNDLDDFYLTDYIGNESLGTNAFAGIVLPKFRGIKIFAESDTEYGGDVVSLYESWNLIDIFYEPKNLTATKIEEGENGYFAKFLFNTSINLNYDFNSETLRSNFIFFIKLPYFNNSIDSDTLFVCSNDCLFNHTYELDLSLNNDIIESKGYFDEFLEYLLNIKMVADYGEVEIPLYYYFDYAPPEVSVQAVSHDNASQALDTTYFYLESCYSDVYICKIYVDDVLKMVAKNCTNINLTDLLPAPHTIRVVWEDAAGNAYQEMFIVNTSYAYPYCNQHYCYYDGHKAGEVRLATYPYENISINQDLRLVRNISLTSAYEGIYLDSSWKDNEVFSLQYCDVLKLNSGFLLNCTSSQKDLLIDAGDGSIKGVYYGMNYYRQNPDKISVFNRIAYVLNIKEVLVNESVFTNYKNVSYDFCSNAFYDLSRLNKAEGCKGYIASLTMPLNLTAYLEVNNSLVAVPLYDYYLPHTLESIDLREALNVYHNFTLRNYDGFAYEDAMLNMIPESQILNTSSCKQEQLYYDIGAYETKILAVPYKCELITEQHETIIVESNSTDKHVRIIYNFFIPSFISDAFSGNYTYEIELPNTAYYVYAYYGEELDLTKLIDFSKQDNIVKLSLDSERFKQNAFSFVIDFWYRYYTLSSSRSSSDEENAFSNPQEVLEDQEDSNNKTLAVAHTSHPPRKSHEEITHKSEESNQTINAIPQTNTVSLSKSIPEHTIEQGWFSSFTGRYLHEVVSNSYLKIIFVLIILMVGVIAYKKTNKYRTRSSQTPRLAYLKKLKEVV